MMTNSDDKFQILAEEAMLHSGYLEYAEIQGEIAATKFILDFLILPFKGECSEPDEGRLIYWMVAGYLKGLEEHKLAEYGND